MTREQIASACKRAGFPQPKYGRRFATIRVPILGMVSRLPDVSEGRFDTWCGELSHAAVARFVNLHLGTLYTGHDVGAMRRGAKPISSRIRRLVRDYGEPYDPKNREGDT